MHYSSALLTPEIAHIELMSAPHLPKRFSNASELCVNGLRHERSGNDGGTTSSQSRRFQTASDESVATHQGNSARNGAGRVGKRKPNGAGTAKPNRSSNRPANRSGHPVTIANSHSSIGGSASRISDRPDGVGGALQQPKPVYVIHIDMSEFSEPSAAEIVWRLLDPAPWN